MSIDQSAMCYISMDSSWQALQTNGKIFIFQISNLFLNYWLQIKKYSINNKVGFMQARWGRHLCWSARVLVLQVFSMTNEFSSKISPLYKNWVMLLCSSASFEWTIVSSWWGKYKPTGPRQFICPCSRLFDLSELGFELDAQHDIASR